MPAKIHEAGARKPPRGLDSNHQASAVATTGSPSIESAILPGGICARAQHHGAQHSIGGDNKPGRFGETNRNSRPPKRENTAPKNTVCLKTDIYAQ
jgi:hypothetical protein